MPTINRLVETNFIDRETGEVVKTSTNQRISWGAEPSYIKLYLDDVLYLSDLPTKHSAILYELLKRATYAGEKDGMQVVVNSGLKRIIQAALNFKNISSINNAITDLVKGKILYRVDTGVYNFNPYLFGKGDWQSVAKLRLKIDYSIHGKTFKAVCSYNDKEGVTENEDTAGND